MMAYNQHFLDMCKNGGTEEVRAALVGGVDPNMKEVDWPGRSAIHIAAEEGHRDVVALLLEGGVDVNAVEIHGQTLWTMQPDGDTPMSSLSCSTILEWMSMEETIKIGPLYMQQLTMAAPMS